MAPIRWKNFSNSYRDVRPSVPAQYSGRTKSSLLFLLDPCADDVGHVGIAFVLLFDEGGIIKALVRLDLFFTRRGAVGWLLALLLGLGIFKRDEFGVCRLRYDFNF